MSNDDLKILIIGDPHFKKDNVKVMDEMVIRIVEIAHGVKPDLIVNLGDTLDTHETYHSVPHTMAIEFMRKLKDIAPTVIIIGNHDRVNNSVFLTKEHPFNALHDWPNTTVVDVPKVLTIKNRKLLFVPYVYPGRLFEAIDTLPGALDPMPDLVFSHNEYRNAKMGVIKSEIGDKLYSCMRADARYYPQ